MARRSRRARRPAMTWMQSPQGNGSTFPSNLSLSCASSGMPALSTCSFTPSQVSAGSGDTNVRRNVVTTSASGVTAQLTGRPASALVWRGTLGGWHRTGFWWTEEASAAAKTGHTAGVSRRSVRRVCLLRKRQQRWRKRRWRESSRDHSGKLHGHCQRHGRDCDAEHAGGVNGPITRTVSMPVFLVYVGRLLRASSSAPRTGSITPGLMATSGCSERRRL
jgi:hypothetical protein